MVEAMPESKVVESVMTDVNELCSKRNAGCRGQMVNGVRLDGKPFGYCDPCRTTHATSHAMLRINLEQRLVNRAWKAHMVARGVRPVTRERAAELGVPWEYRKFKEDHRELLFSRQCDDAGIVRAEEERVGQ